MTNARPLSRPSHAWLPLAFMLAVLVLRVLRQHGVFTDWPNFSPLMAFAFAGAVVFPRPFPWWSWAIVLLAVDLLSENSAWWRQADGRPEVLLTYACYALAAFWGGSLRGRAGVVGTLVGTVTCSVMFYIVSNTTSWWLNPAYAKTAAGWAQSLTVGEPGVHPTTIEFFRNSLLADMAGASLLLILYNTEAVCRSFAAIPLFTPRAEPARS